jgi:hypothetical protein
MARVIFLKQFNARVISLLTAYYNGELFYLEMNQEPRIVCYGHVCKQIGMKLAIVIEDLP